MPKNIATTSALKPAETWITSPPARSITPDAPVLKSHPSESKEEAICCEENELTAESVEEKKLGNLRQALFYGIFEQGEAVFNLNGEYLNKNVSQCYKHNNKEQAENEIFFWISFLNQKKGDEQEQKDKR